jgi:sortase (surface protein transpeptidase)
MLNKSTFRSIFKNRYLQIGVAVLCVAVMVFIQIKSNEWFSGNLQPIESAILVNDTLSTTTSMKSIPVRLRVPSISLDTEFVEPLGLLAGGEVAVPDSFTDVGWYKHGPTPGEIGPSVILGHVDSVKGPAVFYSLGQISIGDEIFVDREDGTTVRFIAEKLERYKQSEFPTEQVYGNIPYAGLRLITCTGTYDKQSQRYTHNLVIYAKLN